MALKVIILAAGQGTRMKSKLPKVLQKLAGKYLIEHVVNTAEKIKADEIIVIYGHLGGMVKSALSKYKITWVEQKELIGTGNAVLQTLDYLDNDDKVVILYGDVPLISLDTLEHFAETTTNGSLGILTAVVNNPRGLGRIIRNKYHEVERIVEEKDATDIERQINEINTGIYCVFGCDLHRWLPLLSNKNSQNEYYLTDIVGFANAEKLSIKVSNPIDIYEISGVNSRFELAELERKYQLAIAKSIMEIGVSFADPSRFDARGDVTIGKDSFIDINVILIGNVTIGENCYISSNCIIENSVISDDVIIKSNTNIDSCLINKGVEVGPFARLRPGTILQNNTKIGNFVEIKNTTVFENSKINHLSYIGDADIGKDCNIGAGVITCNYDGVNKHKTIIEDNCFIGSNSQLIAPVVIKKNSTVAAGSTITKNTDENSLAVARARQVSLKNWIRPKKNN